MRTYIEKHPVIAILRGVLPSNVVEIAHCLYQHGVRVIEVPLNSPQPFVSIGNLVREMPNDCLIGAGTVLTTTQVDQVFDVGGKLIFSPHYSQEIVTKSLSLNLEVVPGIATATEAVNAYQAGARWLKLFPAQTYGVDHISALKSVLPYDTNLIAVGGVDAKNSQLWLSKGADALGLGNSVFKANDSLDDVRMKITNINNALKIAT